MRHVWSLIAGVVIAPLAWFLIAFGEGAMSRGGAANDFKGDYILGGLLIMGIGLLLGLISSLRTSPVGALVASLTFLGASIFALFARTEALQVFSREVRIGDYTANIASPLNSGVLAVAGGMLLIAVFSAARWRTTAPVQETAETWTAPPPPEAWAAATPAAVSAATESGESRPS
jgi:hypothetical protein